MGTAPAKVPHVERREDSQKMLPSNKTQINEYERRERERKEGKERRREGRKRGGEGWNKEEQKTSSFPHRSKTLSPTTLALNKGS